MKDLLDKEIEQEHEKEFYSLDKIERLNIPQLENRISKICEELGYTKFQLEKPELKKHAVVPFNVQDPTSRSEKESLRQFRKIFKNQLLRCNWRLVGECYYRLGYITGKLKACEDNEDLIKIAKEISETNPAK